MRRSSVNCKDVFREATEAYFRDLEAGLRQRRDKMESAWDELDEGWAALETKMNKLGFRPAENIADGMLKLNVGGAPVDLWRSSLTESEHARQSKLGLLFNGVWDKRLPLDSNERIVLDESSASLKHLINALLKNECSSPRQGSFSASKYSNLEVVDPCDRPYMESLERFLELSALEPEAMTVSGGGKILARTERRAMLHQLKSWLDSTGSTGMNLLYQASRDGFSPESFHKCCDGARSTVTLFEVHGASKGCRSIVGGYSGTSWAPLSSDVADYDYKKSPGSFIFLLKDGQSGASPKNWVVSKTYDYDSVYGDEFCGSQAAVYCSSSSGPRFGINSLSYGTRNDGGKYRNLCVQNTTYNHKDDNSSAAGAFRALNGARVARLEVYSLHNTPSATPSSFANQRSVASRHSKPLSDDADTRLFGTTVAGCLARERYLLDEAEVGLAEAKAMVKATASALEDIYGPHIAAGKEDPVVVKLNVRGRSFTTLLSTLQACPDSALAACFNSERCPPMERDLDAYGCYVVDCDPLCFSKMLDVLRIQKRASWSPKVQSKQVGSSEVQVKKSDNYPVRVVVPGTHKESFSALVDMLFPGNRGFITDFVKYEVLAEERKLN